MKPRRDTSGAFVKPMTSDVRSDSLGWIVIRPSDFRTGRGRVWAGGRQPLTPRRGRLLHHGSDAVSAVWTDRGCGSRGRTKYLPTAMRRNYRLIAARRARSCRKPVAYTAAGTIVGEGGPWDAFRLSSDSAPSWCW